MPQHNAYREPPEGLVFVGGSMDGQRAPVEDRAPTTFQILQGAIDNPAMDQYTMVHLVFRIPTDSTGSEYDNYVVKYMRHMSLDDYNSMLRLLKGYRRKPRRTNATQSR